MHCALKLQACLYLIVDIKHQQKKIYLATWIPQLYGGEGLERGIITLTRVTQIRITLIGLTLATSLQMFRSVASFFYIFLVVFYFILFRNIENDKTVSCLVWDRVIPCSPLTAVLKCEHHELQAAEFFLTHPRRPRGS